MTVFWDVAPWRQYAPLKRRSISIRLDGATSQKTVSFILVVVKSWNLTNFIFVHVDQYHLFYMKPKLNFIKFLKNSSWYKELTYYIKFGPISHYDL
jgi:hypothetical protein